MKKFTSNLKLFLLLAAMVAGVSDVWGGTVTFNGAEGNRMDTSGDGVTFTLASFNHYSKTLWGKTTYYYYYLGSGNNGYISWSVPAGKVIRITGITINAQNQNSWVGFEKKTGTGYIYSSLLSESNKIKVCNTTSPANYSYTNTGNSNLLGTNGLDNTDRLYFYAKDREFQFKTITITYSIEDLATYYFKSVAEVGEVKGGSVQTTFSEGAYTSSPATTSQKLTTPKAETPSISKDVWYKAAVSGTNKFSGWAETSNGTPISSANPYKTTITATKDNTSEATAATKTLYAIFSSVLKPVINGSDKVDAKVGLSYVADFSFENVANTVPGASSNGSNFYYTISHNVTTSNTNGSADGSKVISYNPTTNTVTPLNEGTATITFTQNGTAEYEYATKSFLITVTKNENPILLSIDGNTATAFDIPFGNKKELTIASDNDATTPALVVANVSGDAAAYSEEGGSHYISAGVNTGDASWTVTQAEDYKYKQGTATFSVHVGAAAEATDCYVLTHAEQVEIGDHSGGAFVNYHFKENVSGNPDKLYIEVKKQNSGTQELYIKYCGEVVKTFSASELPTSYTQYTFALNSDKIGEVEIYAEGTLSKFFRNLRVTRKTYLNAADVTVNKTSGNNLVCPGDQGVGTLVINRSLANGGDLKVTWDNAKFTINGKTSAEGVNLGNFDCTTGVSELPIIFNADTAGTEVAHVTIYNNVYSATATITGEAVKRTQDFTWHIDNAVSTGFTIATADAFTSTRSPYAGVTYTFSNTAIMDIEDGNIVAKAAGDVTITAHVDGGAEYQDLNETKTVTVTEDLVQTITWTQSLLGLKLGDPDLTLTATATSEVPGCTTNGSRLITYESGDETIVKVINGNQLQIVGLGTTKLIARQAGGLDADGHTYIAVEIEKKVVVKDPSAPCETIIYEQEDNWEGDLGWNAVSPETKTVEFDFLGNEPGEYTLEYSGKPHTVAIQYYDGALYIDEYYDGAWHNVESLGKPTANVYATATHSLNRKATKMRVRADGKTGYYYAKDCQVTLARYIELQDAGNVVSTLAFSTKCGASQTKDVTVHYSNLTDNLNFTLPADCPFSLDKTAMEASCGDKGTLNLKITYTPMAPETDATYDLTLSDGTTTTVVTLHASSTISERALIWEQTPATTYTVQTVNFTAVAQTTLGDAAGSVAYTIASSTPADMATISGSSMTFTKAGEVTVEAAAVQDARYTMPAPQTKTWTVVKTPTVVAVSPTITTSPLVAGADVAALTFNPGVAKNTVNAEEVSGTFTITSTGSLVSGANTVWFEFTPDDTDMYLPTTASVEIEVLDAFVFEGNGGISEEWGSNTNWNTGTTPSATDNVIINSDVTIVGDIKVHSLTINEGVHVTVDVNGSLTVGDGGSRDAAEYGDLIIEAGAKVVFSNADVKVRNFYINTELGDDTHAGVSSSSQLDGSTHLEVLGDAFIDIKMDPSDTISYGFYDFVLPFPCDAKTGVSYIDATGAEHPMVLNRDYAFSAFSEATRATGAYAWSRFNGVLEAGLAYSITLDDDYPERNVIRFRKTATGAINTSNTTALQVSDGNDVDKGWNGIGNATLSYADLSSAGVSMVQVYSHATNSYSPVDIDAFTYVVGSSFFVQVGAAQDMTFVRQNNPSVLRAPSRNADDSNEQFMIEFAAEQSDYTADRLYLSADEDALSTYEIGHDLLKFGNPNEAKKAQISGLGYGKNLCQMHFPMLNNEAVFPVSLFAPAAGDYVLRAAGVVDGQDLYLLENGVPVWNLSDGEYTLSLDKGSNTDYSLAIRANAPAVPTGTDAVASDADVEKMIINGALFVRKNGMIFDAMGNRVK